MSITNEVLAILVCPVCKKHLQSAADNSGYSCEACGRFYPVRDGIPMMIPEDATRASESATAHPPK